MNAQLDKPRNRFRPTTAEHKLLRDVYDETERELRLVLAKGAALEARLATHPRYCALALCIGLVVGLVCGRAWL